MVNNLTDSLQFEDRKQEVALTANEQEVKLKPPDSTLISSASAAGWRLRGFPKVGRAPQRDVVSCW